MIMSGSNTEEGARIDELTKKLEKAADTIEALEATLEKQKGIVENAEKKFNDWSNEVGELRKREEAREARESELLKQIEQLKASGPSPEGGKSDAAELADLEKELTPEEEKLLDEAFKQAPEEMQKAISGNVKQRISFIKKAKSTSEPALGWRSNPKPAPQKQEKFSESLDALFDAVLKRKRHIPDGSTGGGGRAPSGNEPEKRNRGPVAAGVLGQA
jgi:DNA repair exonuclease SbcCD ATPase subunit